jgi:hypothetical protein
MSTDLSFQELAAVTGRHIETLRVLARMGRLPGCYKLGGRWAISREAADRLRHVPTAKTGTDEGGDIR